jgi:uncharacterized membrane protein YraQ (UPF0718 family)/regulator of protease activity HflC (stomatin/prohibitin superfamily)
MSRLLPLLGAVLSAAWDTFVLAAPYVLFGLLVAALLQVLISQRQLARWMGGGGLAAAARAALLGLPLPICSCGIVPVGISLRKKGASRPALLSFLITTPESSADAVVLTWGLMGPLMTLARLVTALLSALVAAVLAIATDDRGAAAVDDNAPNPASPGPAAPPAGDEDANYLGFRGLGRAVAAALHRLWSPPPRAADPRAATAATAVAGAASPPAADSPTATTASGAASPPAPAPLAQILRAAGRHAFVELVDDIVFWLVVGVLAAGIIAALVPPELVAAAGAGGLRSMLILMVVAIPIYVCASASTPIAAALVAKGVSPGAALVFLLTGPATNTATVSLLARNFGGRFLRIYLGSVLATALLCGLALDAVLAATSWQITGRLASEAEGIPAFFELLCALALAALVVWRLWAGAARQGVRELAANLRGVGRWLARTARPAWLPWRARWLPRAALAAAALAYLASGLAIVPAGAIGYELLCGRLVRPPLAPGLHWLAPRPFARIAIWRLQYPRRADVGFRTDLALLARRQELMRQADPAQWHSPVAAMNTDSREASYLAGDENLLEMSFTVRYGLADPYAFLYHLDREHDLVGLCAQAVARELVAAGTLDELLTAGRAGLETRLAGELQRRLDLLGAGVRIASVHIVDLHPPQDAVFAFRDVSSAREDRDRRIQTALAEGEKEVPTARGNAALAVGEAQAKADGARAVATGRAEGFVARAAAFAGHRDILRDLLWLETEEKVLPGRRKFILPKGAAGGRVVLWPDKPVAQPIPPPTDGE